MDFCAHPPEPAVHNHVIMGQEGGTRGRCKAKLSSFSGLLAGPSEGGRSSFSRRLDRVAQCLTWGPRCTVSPACLVTPRCWAPASTPLLTLLPPGTPVPLSLPVVRVQGGGELVLLSSKHSTADKQHLRIGSSSLVTHPGGAGPGSNPSPAISCGVTLERGPTLPGESSLICDPGIIIMPPSWGA